MERREFETTRGRVALTGPASAFDGRRRFILAIAAAGSVSVPEEDVIFAPPNAPGYVLNAVLSEFFTGRRVVLFGLGDGAGLARALRHHGGIVIDEPEDLNDLADCLCGGFVLQTSTRPLSHPTLHGLAMSPEAIPIALRMAIGP